MLARLDAGFAVIDDVQFLPGYCVFITDTPGVDRLTDLPRERRHAFLAGAELLAEAVQNVCARSSPPRSRHSGQRGDLTYLIFEIRLRA